MKSKKAKYILIPIVAIIWGIIIVRIISMLNPPNNAIEIQKPIIKKRIEKQEEKYELLMDYPDPFKSLKKNQSQYQIYQPIQYQNNENSTKSRTNKLVTKKTNNPETHLSKTNHILKETLEIQYIGMVNNNNPASKTAYIFYKDNYFLCQPGDSIQSIIIQSFTKDKLTISANDSIIYFDKIGNN